jgi:hypothetical protein
MMTASGIGSPGQVVKSYSQFCLWQAQAKRLIPARDGQFDLVRSRSAAPTR